jgi:hypothetical protein
MNHLNESVLMYDDFRFVYSSEPGGKPSANSCALLASLKIRTGGRNGLAALQHVITVMFHSFLPMLKHGYFRPFFCYTELGLYATFISVPWCVRKIIFGRYFLQHVKKKVFRLILWAVAKDTQQSYPAVRFHH